MPSELTPKMRWTCAIILLLGLAGGRAETRVVVEDFATTTGLWTDTGQVLGLPESIQPPIGTIQLTNEGETLRFDYDVAFKALYGAAVLGRTLDTDETSRGSISQGPQILNEVYRRWSYHRGVTTCACRRRVGDRRTLRMMRCRRHRTAGDDRNFDRSSSVL